MNERERILELVKSGVLETDEALDLLESLAQKENKQTANTEFSADKFETDQSAAEDIEDLATDMTNRSAQVDALNVQISDLKSEISDLETELDQATRVYDDFQLDQIEQDIEDLKVERDLVKEMVEIDNTDELKAIDQEIKEKEADLDQREDNAKEINDRLEDLTMAITEKSLELDDLMDQRDMLLEEVNGSKGDSFSKTLEDLKKQLQFSDEFKESASQTINQAGSQVNQAGKELNKVFKDMVNSSKSMLDNFEWKKTEFKVPTLVKESFSKTWTVDDLNPTILDIKNANGKIEVERSQADHIEIQAEITLYGKLDKDVEAAFADRSVYKVDEDRLVLHIPNKRVKANLTLKLPDQTFDYVSFNLLNGDLTMKDLDVNDVFIKNVSGEITAENVSASMVELKSSNTEVDLLDLTAKDLLVSNVNGDVVLSGEIMSATVSTTNGDIRATLLDEDMVQFEGTSLHGDVKVAVPRDRDLTAEAKTGFGKVYSRLSDAVKEEANAKQSEVRYVREGQGNSLRLKARTASGNILLKDSI